MSVGSSPTLFIAIASFVLFFVLVFKYEMRSYVNLNNIK
jgi:hypothetical protein